MYDATNTGPPSGPGACRGNTTWRRRLVIAPTRASSWSSPHRFASFFDANRTPSTTCGCAKYLGARDHGVIRSIRAETFRQSMLVREQIPLSRQLRITRAIPPERRPDALLLRDPPDREIGPVAHDRLALARAFQKTEIAVAFVRAQLQVERLRRPEGHHVGFGDAGVGEWQRDVPSLRPLFFRLFHLGDAARFIRPNADDIRPVLIATREHPVAHRPDLQFLRAEPHHGIRQKRPIRDELREPARSRDLMHSHAPVPRAVAAKLVRFRPLLAGIRE